MPSTGLSDNQDKEFVRKLSAISHPARLNLLRCLGEKDACCVKDLVGRVGLAQSTVSQHVKILLEADLVTYKADRQSSQYSLNRDALGSIRESLDIILWQVCGENCCGHPGEDQDADELTAHR